MLEAVAGWKPGRRGAFLCILRAFMTCSALERSCWQKSCEERNTGNYFPYSRSYRGLCAFASGKRVINCLYCFIADAMEIFDGEILRSTRSGSWGKRIIFMQSRVTHNSFRHIQARISPVPRMISTSVKLHSMQHFMPDKKAHNRFSPTLYYFQLTREKPKPYPPKQPLTFSITTQ